MKTKLIKLFSVILLIAAFLGMLAGFQFDIFTVNFICELVGFITICGCLGLMAAIVVSVDEKKGEKEDVK